MKHGKKKEKPAQRKPRQTLMVLGQGEMKKEVAVPTVRQWRGWGGERR